MTTGFLQEALIQLLRREGNAYCKFEKGTLPDPHTVWRGRILWTKTEVKVEMRSETGKYEYCKKCDMPLHYCYCSIENNEEIQQ